jgi:transcriptional regulator GlxA family with amidase domain
LNKQNSEYAGIHSRPRLSTLENLSAETIPTPSRGGLPPRVLQRICEQFEAHMEEKISVDTLATLAGLSAPHFTRAFSHSAGLPPHTYVLRRRLERAELMVRNTQSPLSEIAAAMGFADQSHLTRHFHCLTGVAPSLIRWNAR